MAKTNWATGDQVTATALNDLGTDVNSRALSADVTTALAGKAAKPSGTADTTTFYRGDGTWAVPPTGSGGGSSAPRVVQQAFASTVTPNAATTDILEIAPLTGNLTLANPSGTPADGQAMRLRFTQDTTGGRTITWGSAYAFGTDVLASNVPTTANSKWLMGIQYNATDSKWRVVAMARGF